MASDQYRNYRTQLERALAHTEQEKSTIVNGFVDESDEVPQNPKTPKPQNPVNMHALL